MDEQTPPTEPGRALTPPLRQHDSALAASAPSHSARLAVRRAPLRESLRGLVDAALDRLDVAGDWIADAAGLR